MTKLERANPVLTTIASKVDPRTKICHRAGAYWLGDLQLTYERDVTNGRNIALDWPAKVALAEHILRRVLDARADPAWGSVWERQRRVLTGLREDVCPSFRRGMFCHWRHPSLDDGCLVARSLGRGYTAYLNLVGEPQHAAEAVAAAESPEQARALDAAFSLAPWVLLAWGDALPQKILGAHAARIAAHAPNPGCLGLTQSGAPRHPLFVRTDCGLQPYRPEEVSRG